MSAETTLDFPSPSAILSMSKHFLAPFPAKPDATSTARSSTLVGHSSLLKSSHSLPSVASRSCRPRRRSRSRKCQSRRWPALKVRRSATRSTSLANAGRRRPSERKVPSAVSCPRQRGRSEVSFCRLRSAHLHDLPRSDRAPDDPAKFHPVRACKRFHLQTCRAEFRPVPGAST